MTTESDFQRMLDRDPSDWQTRLILADFLEGQDNPRAGGYRAMGVLHVQTDYYSKEGSTFGKETWCWWVGHLEDVGKFKGYITGDWYALLVNFPTEGPSFKDYHARQSAEDEAALAFLKLPPDRQRELLGGVSVGSDN